MIHRSNFLWDAGYLDNTSPYIPLGTTWIHPTPDLKHLRVWAYCQTEVLDAADQIDLVFRLEQREVYRFPIWQSVIGLRQIYWGLGTIGAGSSLGTSVEYNSTPGIWRIGPTVDIELACDEIYFLPWKANPTLVKGRTVWGIWCIQSNYPLLTYSARAFGPD